MNRTIAHFFSWIGLPLLMLTYMLVLLMLINPYAFGVRDISDTQAVVLLLSVFGISFVIPGIGLAVMKPLGLVRSLSMPDKQDRTGPYIVSGVFYLWLFKNLLSNGHTPPLYTGIVLGATIGLFVAFFINIFTKVSAHASGVGGLVGALVATAFSWPQSTLGIPMFGGTLEMSLNIVLVLGMIFAGLVGVSRLALGAHTSNELYIGYATGFFSMMLAWAII
jgi:hypothetical protein